MEFKDRPSDTSQRIPLQRTSRVSPAFSFPLESMQHTVSSSSLVSSSSEMLRLEDSKKRRRSSLSLEDSIVPHVSGDGAADFNIIKELASQNAAVAAKATKLFNDLDKNIISERNAISKCQSAVNDGKSSASLRTKPLQFPDLSNKDTLAARDQQFRTEFEHKRLELLLESRNERLA